MKSVLGRRFNYTSAAKPVVALPEGAGEAIVEFGQLLSQSSTLVTDAHCVCGARPSSDTAILLATRDRYGFPLKTWLSKKSGLLWTSPRMSESLLDVFYSNYFHRIYRGAVDDVAARFANQIVRGEPLFELARTYTPANRVSGKRVLDVGCGAGGMLVRFRAEGSTVVGIDIGNAKYANFGLALGLDIRNMTLGELANNNRRFDIIISSHVLEHLPEPLEFLRSIYNILADDGIAILEVPGLFNLSGYRWDFLRYLQNSHMYHYSASTLSTLAELAGFSVAFHNEIVRIVLKKTAKQGNSLAASWDEIQYRTTIRRLNGHKRKRIMWKVIRKVYKSGISITRKMESGVRLV